MFQNAKKRAARRAWPIHGYVGPNGSGKTAYMVWDTLPSLEAGRTVLSTVRLLDYNNPRPCEGCDAPGHALGHQQAHPLWVPFTDWGQLLDDADHWDVLMDEVTGVASSRESQGMPAPVANRLVQLRRKDVIVRWSAPSWARADKIIRECSQAVTHTTGYLPVRAESEDGTDRMWRNRRMFKGKTYDADLFEDFSVGKREQLSALTVDWHWGPSSPVFDAYDTLDAVLSIGTVTDSGRCYRCGGRRRVPNCSCPDSHAHDDEDRGEPGGAPAQRGPRAPRDSPPGRRVLRAS